MNNGKKYLIIASGVLLFLMICVFILQSLLAKSSAPNPNSTLVSPTINPYKYKNTYRTSSSSAAGQGGGSSSSENKAQTELDRLKKQLPIETDNYVVVYSSSLDKVIMTRKTDAANDVFDDWLIENNYSDLVNNPYTTIYTSKTAAEIQMPYVTDTPEQRLQKIYDMAGIVLQKPNVTPSKIPTPTLTPTPTPKPSSSQSSSNTATNPPKEYNGYVYYSQCHGQYDNYQLTDGCSLCHAGCGPTTAAMILSTYVDKKYTPPTVVELYRDITSALCGTYVADAKRVLSSHGVRTSDYIVVNQLGADIKDVVGDLRKYINDGWTIMALTYFKPNQGGGHYFWITDIDSSGNVWAFDPYYGMDQAAPINENVRYPFPTYWYAFGVKKQ